MSWFEPSQAQFFFRDVAGSDATIFPCHSSAPAVCQTGTRSLSAENTRNPIFDSHRGSKQIARASFQIPFEDAAHPSLSSATSDPKCERCPNRFAERQPQVPCLL